MTEETRAIVALSLSVLSFLIAGTSLGWNIYRDVILKPRLKIIFGIRDLVDGEGHKGTFVWLSAVNLGPGPIHCNAVHVRDYTFLKKLARRATYAMIVHDMENPLSWKLPCKLEVGETATLLFKLKDSKWMRLAFNDIGLVDSFGTYHWAPRTFVRHTKAEFDKIPAERFSEE